MSGEALRGLSQAHGMLAWAAVAVTVAAAVAVTVQRLRLRLRLRAMVALAGIASLLLIASFVTGLQLDLPYRGRLRQRIFLEAPALGWMFERKLHLGFGAMMLAGCALGLLGAAALAGRRGNEQAWVRELGRGGKVALVAGAAFALLAAVVGAWVARRYTW